MFLYSLRSSIGSWWYNFGWSEWVGYLDGWLARFALLVPIFAYLILFADQIGGSVQFQALLGSTADFGLDGQQRLRLVYFGLFFLGASNFLYRARRPYAFRFGTDRASYSRSALEIFTYQDLLRIHGDIRRISPYTVDGKYYDSEWNGFVEAATNRGEGTNQVERTGHWEDAKLRYGSLLRSMFAEHFFRANIQRRGWLVACITLSTIGYLLLIAPSVDLFVKVVVSTIHSLRV